jgi:hypothetical protein
MALPTMPKTIFEGSLSLARAPLDAALKVAGSGPDSAANQALDRVEASARNAVGTIFRDEGLRRDAQRQTIAGKERERAQRLQEAARREERERSQRLAEEAERARRESAKLDRATRLQEVEAREQSLDAKEAAVRAEREAEQVRKKAAKAKKARKAGGATRKPKASSAKPKPNSAGPTGS